MEALQPWESGAATCLGWDVCSSPGLFWSLTLRVEARWTPNHPWEQFPEGRRKDPGVSWTKVTHRVIHLECEICSGRNLGIHPSSVKANSSHPRTSTGEQKTADHPRTVTNDPKASLLSGVMVQLSAFTWGVKKGQILTSLSLFLAFQGDREGREKGQEQ